MRKIVLFLSIFLMAVSTALAQNNTVVFDNQSGESALVKLIGPTSKEVEVPNGAKQSVDASAGRYIIKVRYGTPGKFHYAKGQEFEVTETTTARSETTITLHKVVAGNYESLPISETDFGLTAGTPPKREGGTERRATTSITESRQLWDWVLQRGEIKNTYDLIEGTEPSFDHWVVLKTPFDSIELTARFGKPKKVEKQGGVLARSAGRVPPETCEYWYYNDNLRVAVAYGQIHEIFGNYPTK